MDSGSAVPTLRPGLSEIVAEKLFNVARVLLELAIDGVFAPSCWSGGLAVVGGGPADFMLIRKAFFLAALSAGRSKAASNAIIAITTSSSISVNARPRSFINHLVGFNTHTTLLA